MDRTSETTEEGWRRRFTGIRTINEHGIVECEIRLEIRHAHDDGTNTEGDDRTNAHGDLFSIQLCICIDRG